MIGKKKLRAIRTELRRELARSGRKAGKALDLLIQKAAAKSTSNEGEIETLQMLRRALSRRRKPPRRKVRQAVRV